MICSLGLFATLSFVGNFIRMNKTAMYHSLRTTFLAGEEDVPWHMVLHALREGLAIKHTVTYTLQEKDYKEYPILREVVAYLKDINNQSIIQKPLPY
jgi:succinylglutamate desuccinylase